MLPLQLFRLREKHDIRSIRLKIIHLKSLLSITEFSFWYIRTEIINLQYEMKATSLVIGEWFQLLFYALRIFSFFLHNSIKLHK